MDSDSSSFDLQQKLSVFNNAALSYLSSELLRCCGSPAWVVELLKHQPFESVDELMEKADQVWWILSAEEWKVAFKAHPMIGDANTLREKFAKSSWEGEEQKGTNDAAPLELQELSALNQAYLQKNGFIFLICATGKSASEMLYALKERMKNDASTEIKIAAEEQSKITKLRLLKLLQSIDYLSKL